MAIKDIGDNVRRYMKIRGLTIPQLSEKMEMGTAAISNLLNGKAEPRSSTLLKLADALNVSFDDLLADAPKLLSLRFRTAKTLSGREKAARDQLLHDTAIWLSDYRFLEEQLSKSSKYRLKDVRDKKPSAAAKEARACLSLLDKDSISDISELMEYAGVKLRIRPFGFKRTFGLSIGDEDGGPAIVVNSEDGIPVERQLFTVAHELGHLVMHRKSYTDSFGMENEKEEREADLFAGYFLIPDEALEKEWGDSKGLYFVDRVLKIKKIFKVSYLTILVRLSQLEPGLSLSDLIIHFRQDYKIKYGHDLKGHYEPDALGCSGISPVAEKDPQALDVSDLMEERFARLVREAYEGEYISLGRAGEMLGLSVEDMRNLVRAWQEI
jgi:Zn-dependent peptidase ImmA (M78 family)/DNA-binding Xre family transcriptional regulator